MNVYTSYTLRAKRHCVASCCSVLAAALLLFLSCQEALAAQIRESDIVISSQVGKVRTEAVGRQVESRSIVHSADIRRDSHTGDVNISGKAGGITTQVGGQNSSAASSVGGVSVGNK